MGGNIPPENAHNTPKALREQARIKEGTGSDRDLGTTKAAKMYFGMSEPSPADSPLPGARVDTPSFNNERPYPQ